MADAPQGDATHTHGDGQNHAHPRRDQVVARLARIEGHVRSIREMVLADRDCPEVLTQIAAVRGALQAAGKVILEDHFESCIVSAVERGDHGAAIEEFKQAFSKLAH
jgi:CsoR family transcriptional regulator, copper-sensing transcriptional repressor